MLWLYNNNSTSFGFYQIFSNTNIIYNYDSNIIYSLSNEINNNEINNNELDFLLNIKPDNWIFDIKIIDQIISFTNSITKSTHTFSFKNEFIEPSNNKYMLPIFNFTYKNVNNHRMPNLIENNYSVSKQLNFDIYKINSNILYVIETDNLLKNTKKYWISSDIILIENYLIQNKTK